MKKLITLLLLCFGFIGMFPGHGQNVLDQYLQTALENNISLQQKNLSYEKSLAVLREAKGMFFPKLSLEARFSVAQGGRSFDIPIGDLMNPVYQNLNLINNLNQEANPDYPVVPEYQQIENERIKFLRPTEQETKVRVVMPVFNTAILQNHRIQQNRAEAEKISVEVYQQELVLEVKKAYFNYAKAYQAHELFANTLLLVKENLRTSESLHRNNKVTLDVVYAAAAQLEEVEQQLAEARKNVKVAEAYFNFLLNRNYDTPIELMENEAVTKVVLSPDAARQQAHQGRVELQQLNYYLSVADNNVQLKKNNYLPTINLVADYGFQGTQYSFGKDDDFAMGSIVMSWNLFDPTHGAKVQQAKIERLELEKQKEQLHQQIGLQVTSAYYNLEAGLQQIESATAEIAAAEKAYRLVDKKFSQGQANLVELTDARTQLTNAGQKQIIARYDYAFKLAEFERAIGNKK
ncbi:MAG: hypothetical protein DHS20C18_00400 [Saprospiraceae bacterium]|nr:MAG: hypothetical protein DHS20C18_00400 [Saprospiraceae bacterium]